MGANSLLVTGATGFIGRHLMERLFKEGHKNIVVFAKESEKELDYVKYLEKKGVTVFFGDVTVESSVKALFDKHPKFDAVIHLAALIKPTAKGDQEFIDINVNGTRNIANECEKRGIKRLVFYSTDFVVYSYPTIYGTSKADAEKVLKSSKLDYTILRPTPVYGMGDDKNFITMFDLIKKYPILPCVHCIMQPVSVNDVVSATLACLNNKNTYRKEYNLAGGSVVTLKQIFKILIDEMGLKRVIMPVPGKLIQKAVRVYEKMVPNPIVRDYQVSKWLINEELSIENNKKDFGYNPVTFEEGMRATMRSMGISKQTNPTSKA